MKYVTDVGLISWTHTRGSETLEQNNQEKAVLLSWSPQNSQERGVLFKRMQSPGDEKKTFGPSGSFKLHNVRSTREWGRGGGKIKDGGKFVKIAAPVWMGRICMSLVHLENRGAIGCRSSYCTYPTVQYTLRRHQIPHSRGASWTGRERLRGWETEEEVEGENKRHKKM
jgi:hypothetical protein